MAGNDIAQSRLTDEQLIAALDAWADLDRTTTGEITRAGHIKAAAQRIRELREALGWIGQTCREEMPLKHTDGQVRVMLRNFAEYADANLAKGSSDATSD